MKNCWDRQIDEPGQQDKLAQVVQPLQEICKEDTLGDVLGRGTQTDGEGGKKMPHVVPVLHPGGFVFFFTIAGGGRIQERR